MSVSHLAVLSHSILIVFSLLFWKYIFILQSGLSLRQLLLTFDIFGMHRIQVLVKISLWVRLTLLHLTILHLTILYFNLTYPTLFTLRCEVNIDERYGRMTCMIDEEGRRERPWLCTRAHGPLLLEFQPRHDPSTPTNIILPVLGYRLPSVCTLIKIQCQPLLICQEQVTWPYL